MLEKSDNFIGRRVGENATFRAAVSRGDKIKMIQPGMTPSARGQRRRRAGVARSRLISTGRIRTNTTDTRRATILVASWLILIPAGYFGLNRDLPLTTEAVAVAMLLTLVVINLFLGWIQPRNVIKPRYAVPVTLAQISLLIAIWWIGGGAALESGSVLVLTGAAAFLSLAVVGLSLGEIAAAAVAMVAVYFILI